MHNSETTSGLFNQPWLAGCSELLYLASSVINSEMKIVVLKGRGGWFWHIVGGNGEIIVSSEAYWSKWNAKRAAKKLAAVNNLTVYVDGKAA